jgi:uncharacterized membrane protein YgdD (TMEM256/DUF423 family)
MLSGFGGDREKQQRELLFIAAIMGFLSIVFGAFGGYALEAFLEPVDRGIYEPGMRYAYIHVLAIVGSVLAIPLAGKPQYLVLAAWFFIIGVVIYTGSLILLALTGIEFFAQITPPGALGFLLGWGFFAYAMRRA